MSEIPRMRRLSSREEHNSMMSKASRVNDTKNLRSTVASFLLTCDDKGKRTASASGGTVV